MRSTLSPERKKVLDRIAALLALADSTTFDAEAQSAREAALRLMAAHNFQTADRNSGAGDEFEFRQIPAYFENDVWWDRIVKFKLAELNNCFPTISRSAGSRIDDHGNVTGGRVLSFNFAGRSSDIDAYEYMFGIMLRQRTKAWNDYAHAGGRDKKGAWLYGYAKGMEAKVDAMIDDLTSAMRTQGRNQLAPVSLIERARLWQIEHIGPIGDSLSTGGGGTSKDGIAAGSNVNLYRGEVGQTRPLGQQKRIGRQ